LFGKRALSLEEAQNVLGNSVKELCSMFSSSVGSVFSAKYFSASSRRTCSLKVILKPAPKTAEMFPRKLQLAESFVLEAKAE